MLPRKIRLPQRLASYLRARFKHFLMSYDESETTSCMQFVAILHIYGLRLTILKKGDFLNSKSTALTGRKIAKIREDLIDPLLLKSALLVVERLTQRRSHARHALVWRLISRKVIVDEAGNEAVKRGRWQNFAVNREVNSVDVNLITFHLSRKPMDDTSKKKEKK
jgi:hypothetical protein